MGIAVFIPLLTLIAIAVGLGAIPAAIAKRKHRSRVLWWIAGMFGFPIALVSILCFRDLEQIPDELQAGSRLKEKVVLAVVLVIWVAMVAARFQMARTRTANHNLHAIPNRADAVREA